MNAETKLGTQIDVNRLVESLRAAAETSRLPNNDPTISGTSLRLGMWRAWRIVAAAIEDGEYDLP